MIDHDVSSGLKWILDGDRFGFGMGWTEDSEPRDDNERAGYYIQMAINTLERFNCKTVQGYKTGESIGFCPSCNYALSPVEEFCHKCGQALKWN